MTRTTTAGGVSGATATRDDGDWRHRAACLDEDPELFFSGDWEREPERTARINEAKATCATCPVTATCLRWALDNGEDAGVWGGHTEDERRALKRRNANARRASPTTATRPAPTRKPAAPDTRRTPTDRPTCGTSTGYRDHTRKHERQCDACRAWRAADRAPAATPDCGTLPGYRGHQDRGEAACDPCKAAKAADSAQYRQRNRNAA